MEGYKAKRANIKAQLTRFANKLDELDVSTLAIRLEKVELLFTKYDEVQSEIELLVNATESEMATQIKDREAFEETYYTTITKAREVIGGSGRPNSRALHFESTNNSEANEHNINLPKLNIPTFDGDYGQWLKFRDSFITMIDNNARLSDIQKFHYLEQALVKDAKRTIAALSISGENYAVAWETLKSRYEDENELIQHHVRGIFEASTLRNSSHYELRSLIDTMNNHLQCLKTLNEPTDNWDTLMMYILKSKLTEQFRREWEKSVSLKTERVTLKDMKDFLEKQCKFLYKTSSQSGFSNVRGRTSSEKPVGTNRHFRSYTTITKNCVLCKEEHSLYECQEFKDLTPYQRIQKVREFRLCFNCLSSNHQNIKCKLGPCRKCGRKHNTLLHLERKIEPSSTTQATFDSGNTDTQKNFSACTTTNLESYVLLATACIHVYDRKGGKHECRALLDQGSQPHIITKDLCKKLALSCQPIGTTLSGIENGRQCINYQASTKISSRVTNFSTTITCLVVDKITDTLPSQRIQSMDITIPGGIKLADPSFKKALPIDMLIGAALFYDLLCVGQIRLKETEPHFQKTVLGWIVGGTIHLPRQITDQKVICNMIKNSDLEAQLQKFWTIEHSVTEQKPHLKNDPAEQHFKKTTIQDEKGHFIVSIPFKQNEVEKLGFSKEMAYKRLMAMERKFTKNPVIKERYIKFMEEYEELGHMSKVSNTTSEESTPHFYLPHHAVCKEESTTTKLRVVFDGSAKTTTGLSLNDVQYIGTPVQEELVSILLRFRHHRYVITADVAKMYRQIQIKQEERPMQRILWRADRNGEVSIYELNTVTYGTASAPFIATRCLHEIGLKCKDQHPIASKIIQHDFYVDDLLSGAQTLNEASQLKEELSMVLKKFGFELRKWASNDPRISHHSEDHSCKDISGDKDPKTLGLRWDTRIDVLRYCVNDTDSRKITKRTILSTIAQIFDPLGLVSPAIIQAKLLMQKLWTLKLDWDESLPQDIHTAWIRIYKDIININKIVIPRNVLSTNVKKLEYHGFCDASEAAYGACIYVCSIGKDGSRKSQLLCAKSRVSPLKATSIPRLELLGALLLAQLSHKVSTACNLQKDQWYFWSDSMVTLFWIKSISTKWKTFVANRTAEIQELTNEQWNHVRSNQNPADLISRGMITEDMVDSNLWWNGPSWLTLEKSYWPISIAENMEEPPEQRKVIHSFLAKESDTEILDKEGDIESSGDLFDRFSSFTRLLRTTAYMMRFINNCKVKITTHNPSLVTPETENLQFLDKTVPLRTIELERARVGLIKGAQRQSFSNEISALQKLKADEHQLKSSILHQLNPFVDSLGLLRVGGRLENAQISFDQKHPIILAAKHKLTWLLIKHEHERLLHGGCQTVLASLRKKYWPLTGKNIVKKILRKCIKCFKVRPTETNYIMGNLPAVRITPARAFYNCGVDYAGPVFIKERGRFRTKIKTYICIFICMVTKAVHIELATDLSTEAFLNCLKRFIARRGICKNIYSDNATNFTGARNELLELKHLITDNSFQNQVSNFLSTVSIEWHFIPPNAPNFGGLWEGAVKSAKYHLKRVLGETLLTYEELYTVLTQVESCLNSRPLSPISNDPHDLTPLTPGHFLIGDALTAPPQADLRDHKTNRLNRYQHLQQMLQHFWQRWHLDYLTSLQTRPTKKGLRTSGIEPGTMILLREDNVPPMHWPLGRIAELHPGKDGVTRVVSIKTTRGLIKRPITKICILPVEQH